MTRKLLYVCPSDHQDVADRILFDFFDCCYSLDIPVFLSLGTALGFYCDNGYILSDLDIDVFVDLSRYSLLKLKDTLVLSGFFINSIPGACPNMNIHCLKDSILLDIWFKQRRNFMTYYHGSSFVFYKNKRLRIPSDIESYLSCIYGDWKTPSNVRANCFGS